MLSDAYIEVECDGCGAMEVVTLSSTARGWDEQNVADYLKSIRWSTHGGQNFCEECTSLNNYQPS